MKGANWLMQFSVGFPIAGKRSQESVDPLRGEDGTDILSPDSLFASKTDRFRARALRANSRPSQELRGEAKKKVDKRWLAHPEPLGENGNPQHPPDERINVSFRSGFPQTDILRGCDDFKDVLTSRRCRVDTPIAIPGRGRIASAARILSDKNNARACGKIGHEAEYKALPIRPGNTGRAIIALWGPKTRSWFGFRPRTLLFGSTAAVLHYNCLSRTIASLACRVPLIPTIGYFDDFGFFANAPYAPTTMAAFAEFFEILRLTLKKAKSVIGTHDTFFGISAHFPAPANRMALSLSLPPGKSAHRASLIDKVTLEGHISHALLESLFGRIGYAQAAAFGRFARAMLKPLYTKVYATRYSTALPQPLIRNLRWWWATLLNITPRIISFSRLKPDWSMYTDAACSLGPNGTQIAVIFFRAHAQTPLLQAELALTGSPTLEEQEFFSSISTIFGLELMAIVLAILRKRPMLRNRAITVYTDNNAALAALINGDASPTDAFALVAIFWFADASRNIAIWLERVEKKRNIADRPARGAPIPFPIREKEPFPPLSEALSFRNQHISINAPNLEELDAIEKPATPTG